MTHPSIRRVGPDDWRLFRDVRLASLREAPYAFGSRLGLTYEESDWRARLAAVAQFVAFDGEQPIGTAGALTEGERTDLVSMWVAPEARGTGVGDALVAAVIAEAQVRESNVVALCVSVGNDFAERLYARHGFERTGRTQPIDEDDPDRGIEFEMRLSTPDAARHV